MAVALTTEQAERLERVLRAVTDPRWSAEAVQELRDRFTADMTQPIQPLALRQDLDEVWASVSEDVRNDPRSMDELLGYDEFGLPT